MFGNVSVIWTTIKSRLAALAQATGATWLQAICNVRRGCRHRSPTSVAAAMLQRYPSCYLVNADFWSLPRIDLVEYRTLPDDIPLIRVSEKDVNRLMAGRQGYKSTFLEHGATMVAGDGRMPFPTGSAVIRAIAANGWHILTVDDARRVLEGRDTGTSKHGYLAPYNGWLAETEKDADAIQIADSLFPFCEQSIATRTATMVIYTPGLPRPLRLWRLSLKKIMPPLPPGA